MDAVGNGKCQAFIFILLLSGWPRQQVHLLRSYWPELGHGKAGSQPALQATSTRLLKY